MGIEPTTPSLGSWCSTTELRPRWNNGLSPRGHRVQSGSIGLRKIQSGELATT